MFSYLRCVDGYAERIAIQSRQRQTPVRGAHLHSNPIYLSPRLTRMAPRASRAKRASPASTMTGTNSGTGLNSPALTGADSPGTRKSTPGTTPGYEEDPSRKSKGKAKRSRASSSELSDPDDGVSVSLKRRECLAAFVVVVMQSVGVGPSADFFVSFQTSGDRRQGLRRAAFQARCAWWCICSSQGESAHWIPPHN